MADELLPHLEPKSSRPNQEAGNFVQLRNVPFQPAGTAIGVVYMGSDLGYLPWAGVRPNAGDTVAVIGETGSQVVLPQVKKRYVDPLFGDRCSCRCPGSSTGGLVFLLNSIRDTTILLVVDGETGDVIYLSTLPEVIVGSGIAVDPASPHDLYIIDDRQGTSNLNIDGQLPTDPAKQWVFMLKYTLSGNSYAFSAAEIMPGYPTENPFEDNANSVTVIDGVCWICLASEPATIRKWSGSGFTDLALTLDGAPYVARLLGQVVQVTAKPAPTSSYFVLALVGDTVYEILQFNADGVIQNRMQDTDLVKPKALVTVCNRLYAMNADGASRSDPGAFEEGGGGGGGGGGGEEA